MYRLWWRGRFLHSNISNTPNYDWISKSNSEVKNHPSCHLDRPVFSAVFEEISASPCEISVSRCFIFRFIWMLISNLVLRATGDGIPRWGNSIKKSSTFGVQAFFLHSFRSELPVQELLTARERGPRFRMHVCRLHKTQFCNDEETE